MPLRKRNTTCRNIWYCQKSNGVLRGGGAGLRYYGTIGAKNIDAQYENSSLPWKAISPGPLDSHMFLTYLE